MTFGKWPEEIHISEDQLSRIKSATSAKTTPMSIDKDSMTGIFAGSGKEPYQVNLDSCTCGDFHRRKLPCKHIYRLAIELGVLNIRAESGVNKNSQISLEAAVGELENLCDESQQTIKSFLYEGLFHKESIFSVLASECGEDILSCNLLNTVDNPQVALRALKRNQIIAILDQHDIVGFKRNLSRENLARWCIDNVSNLWDVFPTIYTFKFAEDFQTSQRRAYSYLLRKFDWEFVYDIDEGCEKKVPHGAKCSDIKIIFRKGEKPEIQGHPNTYYFPNDRVTELLTQYGYNRCLNGFEPVDR